MDHQPELSTLLRASTIGSVALSVACVPLDVARHSAQAALAVKQRPPVITDILREASTGGVFKGLWRGLPATTGLGLLSPATFLLVYEWEKSSNEALQAALVARAVQTVLLQPFEVVRTIRQGGALLPPEKATHLNRNLLSIISGDRPRSLWRALVPTMARDLSTCGVFWGSYLALQRVLGEGATEDDLVRDNSGNPAVRFAAMGTVSAILASVVTQPLDVVKTRMQVHQLVRTDHQGFHKITPARFFKTLKQTKDIAGLKGLWTGCLARSLRAGAGGILLGPLYEFGQLIADDSLRTLRKPLVLPRDPSETIVHPRSYQAMFIEIK